MSTNFRGTHTLCLHHSAAVPEKIIRRSHSHKGTASSVASDPRHGHRSGKLDLKRHGAKQTLPATVTSATGGFPPKTRGCSVASLQMALKIWITSQLTHKITLHGWPRRPKGADLLRNISASGSTPHISKTNLETLSGEPHLQAFPQMEPHRKGVIAVRKHGDQQGGGSKPAEATGSRDRLRMPASWPQTTEELCFQKRRAWKHMQNQETWKNGREGLKKNPVEFSEMKNSVIKFKTRRIGLTTRFTRTGVTELAGGAA